MSDEAKVAIAVVVGLLVVICIISALMFGVPSYHRYQALQNAQNQVDVSRIEILNTTQLVEVEKAKANVRVAEAKGISESQKIIDSSLTPNYLQYLAIKAQERMAGSPNHTQIYIPSGPNGIPLIRTVDVPLDR